MTRSTMVGVNWRPSPLGRPRRRRMAAISAQVWWSSSLSISVMVLVLVCRIFQAGSGTGRGRGGCWPPGRGGRGGVGGGLDGGGAGRVGRGGSRPEFGGVLEGGLEGQRGQGVDEKLADVLVEGVAGDGGADRGGVVDAVALAEVGGQVFPAAGVVADGHPPAAAAADDDALQEGGAFAGRPGGAVAAVRGGGCCEPGDVGLPPVQGDVAGGGAGDEGDPLVAGYWDAGPLPAGQQLLAVPAVGERAGVAGVVQRMQHGGMPQRLPVGLALAGAFEVPPGEGQPGGAERLDHGAGWPGCPARGEQGPDRALDGGVAVG